MEKKQCLIKPCPCCGARASIDWKYGVRNAITVVIRCDNEKCGLTMKQSGLDTTAATHKAVNAWNQREAEAARDTGKIPTLKEIHSILRIVCDCCRVDFDTSNRRVHKCAHVANAAIDRYGNCNVEHCPMLARYRDVEGVKDV